MKILNIKNKRIKKYLFSVSIFSLLLLSSNLFAQVTFEAAIENQVVNGASVSFDIFLARTGSNDLLLGNADFVIYFNEANFTAPTFQYEDGTNDFMNSNGAATTSYNDNIVTDESFLSSGQLVINLNQPTFANQTQFNSRIAKINNTSGTYKLGKFTLTGITNPAGSLGLVWKTSLPGVYSNVQTLASSTPWLSSAASGTFSNPAEQPLPVELSSFTAKINKVNVSLQWTTLSEINNASFDVERKNSVSSTWNKITTLQGKGTSNNLNEYFFEDRNLVTGKYNYRLKQMDFNGNFEYFNLGGEVEIGVPKTFGLSQNYPNPFNPATKINYELPFESNVSIRIFDITGKVIKILVHETQNAGYYTVQFNGTELASGIYFYNIVAEGGNNKFIMTKRMMLIK